MLLDISSEERKVDDVTVKFDDLLIKL